MKKVWMKTSLKNSVLSIMLGCGMLASAFTFAENPLVTQAKALQTGSEQVGIDHQKAIALLKKASDEGDAEAMYLLSQYYTGTSEFSYLAENPAIGQDLLKRSAKLGNIDAIDEMIISYEIYNIRSYEDIWQELKPILQKEIQNKNINAMHAMAKIEELDSKSKLEDVCKLYVTAYLLEKSLKTINFLTKCSDQDLQKFDLPERDTLFVEREKMLIEQAKNMLASKTVSIAERRALSEYLHDDMRDEFQNLAKRLDKDIQNFYLKLGRQGYSDAYLMLREEYTNSSDALKWQDAAIKLHNRVALEKAGYAYLYGEMGRKKNQKLGLQYLEQAIQLNDPNAMNTLAIWLINESENSQDEDKAIQLLERAAQLDSTDAMKSLARISESPKNYAWAVKAYHNGANRHVAINEGILPLVLEAYTKGIGVKKDQKIVNKIKQELTQYEVTE